VDRVKLIGLDFGTTTSSALIASARLLTNSVSRKTDVADVREEYRSDIAFTPYSDNRLDLATLTKNLDDWLAQGGAVGQIFGGGALLTGLAAQAENAPDLVGIVRSRLKNAVIASAADPCLESWLAFMGSCATLTREHRKTWFLNLDIGGGTTNLALGIDGEVMATGCLFVGARHVQVDPGSYRLHGLSAYARQLFDRLGIYKAAGEQLSSTELSAVLDFYLLLLDSAVTGRSEVFEEPTARLHEQVPFRPCLPALGCDEVAVTLSGGVGELVYFAIDGKPMPTTTHFGDLGIDLANRLLQTRWADSFRKYIPSGRGRATVYGLMRHSTQVSGSTLFLPNPSVLPLRDLPVLGTITQNSTDSHLQTLLGLVGRSPVGGGLWIQVSNTGPETVRELGERISRALRELALPARSPIVFLVAENLGKTLGQYITQWGTLPVMVVVIDEIAARDAQYLNVGAPHDNVIPVLFYGLQPSRSRHENS
jgi:ethanolamine utilization protein EutA